MTILSHSSAGKTPGTARRSTITSARAIFWFSASLGRLRKNLLLDLILGDGALTRVQFLADSPKQHLDGFARPARNAQQAGEMLERSIRHTVDLINRVFNQKGEQIQERDAGVRKIVVSPGGKMLGDERLRLVHQLVERAIIEIGDWKRHGYAVAKLAVGALTETRCCPEHAREMPPR